MAIVETTAPGNPGERRLDFLPNTPTLMNAGTDFGTCSACFVLPIEDSIEGIFEAIKQSSLVTQGLPGDTPVLTTDGGRYLANLEVDDCVYDHHGVAHKVRAVIPTGRKALVEVVTNKGVRIRCAPEHAFLGTRQVTAGGRPMRRARLEYLQASSLNPGDCLVLATLPTLPGTEQPIDWQYTYRSRPEKGHFLPVVPKVPTAMTPTLAWLMGYFVGNGSFHTEGLRLSVDAEHFPSLSHRLSEVAREIFGIRATTYGPPRRTTVSICNIQLRCLFDDLLAHERHSVPRVVQAAPAAVRWAFLSGLVDADGCIYRSGYIKFSTSYPRLRDEMLLLANSLGLYVGYTVEPKPGYRDQYILRPVTKTSHEAMVANLVLYNDLRRARLRSVPFTNGGYGEEEAFRYVRVRQVLPAGEGQTYGLALADAEEYIVQQLVSGSGGARAWQYQTFPHCNGANPHRIRVACPLPLVAAS